MIVLKPRIPPIVYNIEDISIGVIPLDQLINILDDKEMILSLSELLTFRRDELNVREEVMLREGLLNFGSETLGRGVAKMLVLVEYDQILFLGMGTVLN